MAPPDHVLPSRWATRETAVRQPCLALLATGPARPAYICTRLLLLDDKSLVWGRWSLV